jgi:hypothetical protein
MSCSLLLGLCVRDFNTPSQNGIPMLKIVLISEQTASEHSSDGRLVRQVGSSGQHSVMKRRNPSCLARDIWNWGDARSHPLSPWRDRTRSKEHSAVARRDTDADKAGVAGVETLDWSCAPVARGG